MCCSKHCSETIGRPGKLRLAGAVAVGVVPVRHQHVVEVAITVRGEVGRLVVEEIGATNGAGDDAIGVCDQVAATEEPTLAVALMMSIPVCRRDWRQLHWRTRSYLEMMAASGLMAVEGEVVGVGEPVELQKDVLLSGLVPRSGSERPSTVPSTSSPSSMPSPSVSGGLDRDPIRAAREHTCIGFRAVRSRSASVSGAQSLRDPARRDRHVDRVQSAADPAWVGMCVRSWCCRPAGRGRCRPNTTAPRSCDAQVWSMPELTLFQSVADPPGSGCVVRSWCCRPAGRGRCRPQHHSSCSCRAQVWSPPELTLFQSVADPAGSGCVVRSWCCRPAGRGRCRPSTTVFAFVRTAHVWSLPRADARPVGVDADPGGKVPVGSGPVAQLAVSLTPQHHNGRPVRAQVWLRRRTPPPPCSPAPPPHRRRAGVGRAVAQLAVAVVAPAPQRPVRAHRARIVHARADALPVLRRPRLCWRVSLRRGAVANLAVVVVAPAPECVVQSHAAHEARARGEGRPVAIGD